MKSSLWIVIVLVTGIVGFLVGYSVSSSTGTAHAAKGGAAHQDSAPGYGGAAPAGGAPGYGAPAKPTKEVSTGGYGR